jgi:penicillin-binding protein 1A
VGGAGIPAALAGKTGTTNDARDVWFVGFSSSIVAGCYIGYDQPRSLGRRASGGGMCGPVFAEFMREAVREYGGAPFTVPEGGVFYPIDRYSGQRLPPGSAGDYVVYELFREGEAPFEGLLAVIDGGWGMGSDLPMFGRGEGGEVDAAAIQPGAATGGREETTVRTSDGETTRVPTGTGFGTLSAGGLY